MLNSTELALALNRYEFMERSVQARGLQATRIERHENGGIESYVENLAPHNDLYWMVEVDEDGKASAEFCLWFLDNPGRKESCCLYVSYAAAEKQWRFGFAQEDKTLDSPKGRNLAEKAFGFQEPGEREIEEVLAVMLVKALTAGYASTLPKNKKDI